MSRTTPPSFAEYDPKLVKKFIFHVLEANRDGPALSMPEKEPRHIGEVFQTGYKKTKITPSQQEQKIDALQKKVLTLEKTIGSLQERLAEVSETCATLTREAIKTEEEVVEQNTPQKKTRKTQKKKAVLDQSDIESLRHELRKIESIYGFLRKSGKHSAQELERVRKKLESTKQKIAAHPA
ncbi:MAG: hypothetical protein ACOCWQ_02045 [Nanoarchaeota archaeon]